MNYEENRHIFRDKFGKRIVLSLFKETKRVDSSHGPFFSLADWKVVYIASGDPTEYKAAMDLVGDWDHWLLIRNHPKLKETFDAWNAELETKLRSDALACLIEQSATSTAAAKALADRGSAALKSKRGRKPNRVDDPVEIADEESEAVSKDMQRLGLSVIKGAK